jgi:hypothetical protein
VKGITGLLKRHRTDGSYLWHIDKRVRRYGRLCESIGTADREEAERYLYQRAAWWRFEAASVPKLCQISCPEPVQLCPQAATSRPRFLFRGG